MAVMLGSAAVLAQANSNPDSIRAKTSAAVKSSLVQEASGTTLGVTLNATDGTCAGSSFIISFGWTATTSDPDDGNDVVGMIAYDGNGVAIAADWNGWPVGTTLTETTPFGSGGGINPLTTRPVRIEVYDIVNFPPFGQNTQAIFDNISAQAATVPLLATTDYDPSSDVPDCSNLPMVPLDRQATSIPTMSTLGLGILAGLLGLIGLRRRLK